MRGTAIGAVLLLSTADLGAKEPTESPRLNWSVETGFPWTSVQIGSNTSDDFGWIVGVESALFRRWEGFTGVQVNFHPTPRFAVSLVTTVGWIEQVGTLGRRGPQLAIGAMAERDGPVVPRVQVSAEGFWASSSSLPDYQELDESVSLFSPLTTLSLDVALGIPLRGRWLLEPSMRLGPVDGQFAIPAAAIGLRTHTSRRPAHP